MAAPTKVAKGVPIREERADPMKVERAVVIKEGQAATAPAVLVDPAVDLDSAHRLRSVPRRTIHVSNALALRNNAAPSPLRLESLLRNRSLATANPSSATVRGAPRPSPTTKTNLRTRRARLALAPTAHLVPFPNRRELRAVRATSATVLGSVLRALSHRTVERTRSAPSARARTTFAVPTTLRWERHSPPLTKPVAIVR